MTIGHVNNVVYNRWAESSRVNLLQHLSRSLRDRKEKEECLRLLSNRGVGLIMKSIKTEFKFVSPPAPSLLPGRRVELNIVTITMHV